MLGLICSSIGGEKHLNKSAPAYWTEMFVNRSLIRNHHHKIDIPNEVVSGFGVAKQVALLKDRT